MALLDTNTNIMLDLETTSLAANPCIMEIAAVNFDLNTGEEISSFSKIISLDSCREAGLHVCRNTMGWIMENIPGTLDRSENSQLDIATALRNFASWVRECHASKVRGFHALRESQRGKMPELYVWGNGAFADNRWIDSAFHAVKLSQLMPWTFRSHMCVRTFVRQAYLLTGRDFVNEVAFKGRRHVALDDCRHQVRYLVLARKSMMPVDLERLRGSNEGLPSEAQKEDESEAVKERAEREKRTLREIAKVMEEQVNLLKEMADQRDSVAAEIDGAEKRGAIRKPSEDLAPVSRAANAVSDRKETPLAAVVPPVKVEQPPTVETAGPGQNHDFELGRKTTSLNSGKPSDSDTTRPKGVLITPETSFTSSDTDVGDEPTPSEEQLWANLLKQEEPPNKRRRVPGAVSRQGLLSPETSFNNTTVVGLNPEDFGLNPEDFGLSAEDFGLPRKSAAVLQTPDTSFSRTD